tara:strand:- start:485 stop:610 length:126 start_codon:yes stop_codon:yes gene_type:complete
MTTNTMTTNIMIDPIEPNDDWIADEMWGVEDEDDETEEEEE